MLGSVLFYALYPITRVVIKVSESLVKAASSVLMNGKDECDTGGISPRSLTKRQCALLDEWIGQTSLIQKTAEKIVADVESKCLAEMEKEGSSVDSGCITRPANEDIFRERKAEGIGPETESKIQEAVVQPDSDMLCSDMSSSTVPEGDGPPSSTVPEGDGPREEITRHADVEMMPIVVTQEAEHVSTKESQGDTVQETESKIQEAVVQPDSDMLCSDMSSSTVPEGDGPREEITRHADVEMMPIAVTQEAELVSTKDNQEETGQETESQIQEAVVQPDSDMLCSDMSSSTVPEGDGPQEEITRHADVEMMPIVVTQEAEHVSTKDNQEETDLEACLTQANLEMHPNTDSSDAQRPLITDCPAMDLRSLLAETQTWGSHTQYTTQEPQAEVPGWHFPVGHGLTDMVYCPYWQFPAVSYYPAPQESTEFEVMWRVWEDLPGTQDAAPQTADQGSNSVFDFTFMTYNILAQDLLEGNSELYIHCSDKVLVWNARLKGIILEIKTWRPDILCLQEAQEDHFKKQLQPVLSDLGYTCVYKRRTGSKTDGCAVCYQNKRFSQLSVSLLELRQEKSELLDRDNVAIVLLLQPITSSDHDQSGTPICVANTHLLFNPRRGDIKLAQLVLVLAEIDSVVRRCKAIGRECEVIFCGDFNSFPNMPLYQFVKTGQLYYHGLPTWMISGQEDLSHQMHPRRLYAPLLPSCLGITDKCQYVTTCQAEPPPTGKLRYDQDFLLNLRYCQAACVRPVDLALIPGVTDNEPDDNEKQSCGQRFRKTVCHCLNLTSAYSHIMKGTDRPEVTTVHSNAGATVDYIFYSAKNAHTKEQTDNRAHGGLELLGRLSLLSEEDLWALRGLPNEVFPSDHLSLLAKFRLHFNPL